MRAVIFYLTTFGYIDGDFDAAEKEFVRGYVKKPVAHRVAGAKLDAPLAAELTTKSRRTSWRCSSQSIVR